MRTAAALLLLAAGSGEAREVHKPVRGSHAPTTPPPAPPFDPQQATRQIRARMGVVRACYERAARREPGLHGKLQLGFDIGDAGLVAATEVEVDKLHADVDPSVATGLTDCIRHEALSWQLAPQVPKGGAHVSYVFVFESSN